MSKCSDVEEALSIDLREVREKAYKQSLQLESLITKVAQDKQLIYVLTSELADLKDNLNNALGNEK